MTSNSEMNRRIREVCVKDKSHIISLADNVRGGVQKKMSLSDYAEKGDSVSLAKLGDKEFTMKFIEDSDYTQQDETTKGVKITTVENFDIDGEFHNKFHTTRIAIVNKLSQSKLREAINTGKFTGKVKCVTSKSKSGKDFFELVDAGEKA